MGAVTEEAQRWGCVVMGQGSGGSGSGEVTGRKEIRMGW